MNCKLLIAIACFLLNASAANAAVIDFETTPAGAVPLDDGLLPVASTYNTAGVQISFGFDLDSNGSVESAGRFEKAGTYPGEGFNIGFSGSAGPDTPDPIVASVMDNWFLRSPTSGAPIGRFVIQYTSLLTVTGASGEIWDIDGNQNLGVTEQYAVSAYDAGNNLLAVINSPLGVLDTPIAPLDGRPWTFAFSGLSAGIDHIVITFTGTKTMGIGLAFDNFDPIAVPEPVTSTGLLLASAFGAALLRRNRRALRVALMAGVIAGLAMIQPSESTAATIVYDNLDPTPTPHLYANYGTWTGNFLPNMYAVSGTTFVPTGSGTLDELSLGMLQGHSYGTQAVTLKLSNDVAGNPGPTLWQVNASAPNAAFGTLMILTGLGGPALTAGQTYWLMAETPVDGVTMQNWYANNQGDMGPIISAGTRFANAERWSLRVAVLSIPEPATAALIGAAILGLAIQRRRRVA